MLDIRVEKAAAPRPRPDEGSLGFGKFFTDHMFLLDYSPAGGWHGARIVPFGDIPLSPATMALHYGQELFEGLKAYRTADNKIQMFRPRDNVARLNESCDRLCIPRLDPDDALTAIKALVELDSDWVPRAPDTSLYIRPFIIATDPFVGVRPSETYLFIVILSPVGAYYPTGLNPVKIYVEDEYVRAVRGGVGAVKAGANYAASLKGQEKAKKLGYVQVLWLDGVERKYIDEVGSMNVFFIINGKAVTPALEGSILPGITRRSCIELLRDWGIEVQERRLAIEEVAAAADAGTLGEAFGTGTAAVISPIGELFYNGKSVPVNGNKIGPVSQRLYDTITGIQFGRLADTKGWIERVM